MKKGLIYYSEKGLSIWSWYELMAPMWRYIVICPHLELARMQGVSPGQVHPICVIDDFGNLVKVPA